MNLEVEVCLTSRVVQIKTDNVRVAEAYGRYTETLSDKDFEELLDEIEPYVTEAVEFEIADVRLGHPGRPLPKVPREERD